MISDTTIHKIGASYMALIPEKYVKYYEINAEGRPLKCKIEDLNENEAKLIFQKW